VPVEALRRVGAGWSWLLLLLPLAVLAQPALDAATEPLGAVPQGFDHLSTGFPLDGRHAQVPCEQCHSGQIFRGTPRNCSACHDNTRATGRAPTHIPTQAECDECHNSNDFRQSAVMDHNTITTDCATCPPAPGSHVARGVTADCQNCHGTTTWLNPSRPLP